MNVNEGEVVSVLVPTGLGKRRFCARFPDWLSRKAVPASSFTARELVGKPAYTIVKEGVAHVPEGRQVFPAMSVNENLEVAATRIPGASRKAKIDEVYRLFPELVTRKNQQAGSLSGGEQQMLAIGRAIVSKCDLVLIDEPSMGLAPVIVQRIFRTLKEIVKNTKLTLLIVEQNAKLSLPLSDRIYILSQGSIVMEGPVSEIHGNQMIQDMYFAKD